MAARFWSDPNVFISLSLRKLVARGKTFFVLRTQDMYLYTRGYIYLKKIVKKEALHCSNACPFRA